ncbi:uncharacterized protein LOC126811652 [Patella vulgata]|uniref:uncharacterized protein LOC126811652 n=1 Tax=Patella vulgata TaxID=6465 RepID=UPI00218070D7|nr:uncharacterized protein LOC126811652 [Patella vulgata]XP_050393410.1 uncharacterized protein LOC126811652 [Patella vulgata]
MKWSPPKIEEYIEIFSALNTPEHRETDSEDHDVVTSVCYCRGMDLQKVGIPRMPHGIKSRDFTKEIMSVETCLKVLPKRQGRGRARMLEEREDHFNLVGKTRNQSITCLEDLDNTSTIDSLSTRDTTSETSSLFGDCEFSETDDNEEILPTNQKPICIPVPKRPFVKPPPPKTFNHESVSDFPLLSSNADTDNSLKFQPVKRKRREKRKKMAVTVKNTLGATADILTATKPVYTKPLGMSISGKDINKNCLRASENVFCDSELRRRVSSEQNWKLSGPCVVQLEGVPVTGDLDILEETLNNFGKVMDSEVYVEGDNYTLRYRFSNEDECEWVVSYLHDTDMLYPDARSVLVCFRVE